MRDEILRACESSILTDPIVPDDLIEWAKLKSITVPQSLIDAVLQSKVDVAGIENSNRLLQEQCANLVQDNELLRERITTLEATIVDQENNIQVIKNEELHPKERSSLYTMILAMAIRCYNYNSKAGRQATAKQI